MRVTVTGVVKSIQEKTGTTKLNKPWTSKTLIVEKTFNNFSDFFPIEFFGDACEKVDGIKAGDNVEVECYLGGNEWNDKYFLKLKGNEVSIQGGATSASQPQRQATPEPTLPEDVDSLPF